MRLSCWVVAGCLVFAPCQLRAQEAQFPAQSLEAPPGTVQVFPLPPPPEPPADIAPPHRLWCGEVEFGLNGDEGTTNIFKMRLGASAKRKTDDDLLTLDLLYALGYNHSQVAEDKLIANVRNEWLFHDSPWSIFVDGSAQYDKFRPWDFLLAEHAGVGYLFWHDPILLLKGRVGMGANETFGRKNDHADPEALIGGDFEYRITARQKFVTSADLYPNLGHVGEFRAHVKAAYELLVDPAVNLTLKLGIDDNYDSRKLDTRANDLDYFLMLLWKF